MHVIHLYKHFFSSNRSTSITPSFVQKYSFFEEMQFIILLSNPIYSNIHRSVPADKQNTFVRHILLTEFLIFSFGNFWFFDVTQYPLLSLESYTLYMFLLALVYTRRYRIPTRLVFSIPVSTTYRARW